MTMKIISSRTDIETYVGNDQPDFDEPGLADALVEAIQDADHPDYGDDWALWLGANIGAIRDSVLA